MSLLFRIADYSEILQRALADPEGIPKRLVITNLPRRFHALSFERQVEALRDPPPLVEPKWDALLAAITEHIARLHGHEPAAWAEEPHRFLDEPWIVTPYAAVARDAVEHCPAAFARHAVFIDPGELDFRCGESRTWLPRR